MGRQIGRAADIFVRLPLIPAMLVSSTLLAILLIVNVQSQAPTKSELKNESLTLLNFIIEERKGKAFDWLAELCDDYGHRKTGSVALENAIDHVVTTLRAAGLDVHTEPVPGLPNWIRGDDRAFVMEPRIHRLNILAIDGSPPGQVQAEAVVLENFDELEKSKIKGKIVVFNEPWTGYGNTVKYRGAAAAVAKLGAVGLLVSSVTPFSIYSAHTGSGARGSPIPAASLTREEAAMLQRWYKRGKRIVLKMDISSMDIHDKVISRNVVFEIKGSKFPNEIVLLSGHIDSWDVGQGAMDDGGGIAAVHEAILAIATLAKKDPRFVPKRTIRGVFWTAEEQGMFGAKQYFVDHFNRTNEHFVFVSETDQGAFKPLNYHSKLRFKESKLKFKGSKQQHQQLKGLVQTLNDYGIPLSVQTSDSQGDVSYFANAGVASVNYEADRSTEYYFNFHHTMADYVTIFKEGDLETTAGIFAVLAHAIANVELW